MSSGSVNAMFADGGNTVWNRSCVGGWLPERVPLGATPHHFAQIEHSPYLRDYLAEVLRRCPAGCRTLETGVGTGFGAVWLSLRGVCAEGIDLSPQLVERARHASALLGGSAAFHVGDLFDLYPDPAGADGERPYQVIHHQGVLEHFTLPEIRAALARQVALAEWVVFSVPSVFYPFAPEMGDERLLPLEAWREVLEPFAVEDLRYYGDPQFGGKDHVLAVLKGQAVDDALRAHMALPEDPYLPGISAVVHTRNEARHIGACLETLAGWADEIVVCDMESSDETVEIARRFTDRIVAHPVIGNFDRARNVSAFFARYRWVLFVDADERVPPPLADAFRQLAAADAPDQFDALLVPFRHHFAGKWLQSLYPGYTAPRLLRNGKFTWGARPHEGPVVDGRTVLLPADDPDRAFVHFSFDSLGHYLTKLNRYTDSESENMHRDGTPFRWEEAVAHFARDMDAYFQRGATARDGVHGFLYAFLSGFYRFGQHAKLYERRFRAGQLTPGEEAVPPDTEAVLECALAAVRRERALRERPVIAAPPPLPEPQPIVVLAGEGDFRDAPAGAMSGAPGVVWSGPLWDPSGYGEETRHFVRALESAGVPVSAQALPWSHDRVPLSPEAQAELEALAARPTRLGFTQVIQDFPQRFPALRHPAAGLAVGRTMFETDRLPADWVDACNALDALWVPTEFNRGTFAAAGVRAAKIAVIPGCLDPAPYRERYARREAERAGGGDRDTFTFLSVFDWTLHKGWDVLLRAFAEAFAGRPEVSLGLKVWSTNGYTSADLEAHAAALLAGCGAADLLAAGRVRFLTDRLPQDRLLDLYAGADAFVLPSRGEGWGRPLMEAMALGLPTIGPDWGGSAAFMTEENSYLVRTRLVPVPSSAWPELPTYRGHQWAEPDQEHLVEILRRVVAERRGEARERGKRAHEEITERYDYRHVGAVMRAELERLREAHTAHPVSVSLPEAAGKAEPVQPPVRVCWEGAFRAAHSLALVNREWCQRLAGRAGVELTLVPDEPPHFLTGRETLPAALEERQFAPLSGLADVEVRHFFPPRFHAPAHGRLVLIQPWEYGYLPEEWVEPIRRQVAEVWCYSRYVKGVYERSGIDPAKLRVVPLGVDADVFRPEAAPFVLTTEPGAERLTLDNDEEPFTFLFVGGTLHRKGIDILLDAYLKAFSSFDNVRLVIKDTGTETVYRGQHSRDDILRLAADPTRPAVVYLDQDLPPAQLAGLYTMSHCLVQPYRGEGFCLPALEAMACGVPVQVPEGGPTDDFVDDIVGWRLPARQVPFGEGRIGEFDCAGPTWMLEVAVADLARQMRWVVAHREEAARRGRAARERVVAGWTWKHATDAVVARLRQLAQEPGPALARKVPVAVSPEAQTRLASARQKTKKGPGASGTSGGGGLRPTPTISLCMIVKNEERVLGDCLASVRPWVDEIVLVDTGSTDHTVEIAKQAGARVFHFPWCDDFSAARNVSLEHATGDWLLWMDADDTMPEECGKRLKDLARFAEERVSGFIMQVHIPPAPGEDGFTIVDHVKLFRNRPEHRFEGRIHEQILESISRTGGQVRRSDLYVVHSGYDYSPEGQQKKRQRDLTILEKEVAERPDHPFVWFNVGMTAFYLKDFDRAIEALGRCLTLAKPRESIVRKTYAMLSGSWLGKGERETALRWLHQGLSRFPRDPELLFRAGILYREVGDLARAEAAYRTLLTAREVGHLDSMDVTIAGFKGYHNLALIYQEMGRLSEAEQAWEAAITDNPTFVPSLRGLAELTLGQGRVREALGIVDRLRPFAPEEAVRLEERAARLNGRSVGNGWS